MRDTQTLWRLQTAIDEDCASDSFKDIGEQRSFAGRHSFLRHVQTAENRQIESL